MESNPYQPPVEAEPAEGGDANRDGFPAGLIVLIVLSALHVGVAGLLTLGGLIMGAAWVGLSGMVAIGFQATFFIGLLLRQEWARIMMIWMCYVSVVTYIFQIGAAPKLTIALLAFEVVTLVFAHSRRVRQATRRQSLAQAYVYRETTPDERTG